MPIINGGFETQDSGSGPGVADSWAVTENYTAEEYAEFTRSVADSLADSKETFEGEWPASFDSGLIGAYQGILIDIEPAFFGAAALDAESFEREWPIAAQGPFDYSTLPLLFAEFDSAGTAEDVEDFEEWPLASDALLAAFSPSDLSFASFDTGTTEDVEDFEEQWGGNENYISAFTGYGTDLTAAWFNTSRSSTATYESFEGVRFNLVGAVFAPATDIWTYASHGLLDSPAWVVLLENENGRLPTGYLLETPYVVQTVTTDTFQLAAVDTGPIIDGSDVGFGTHEIRHDRTYWWTEELTGV